MVNDMEKKRVAQTIRGMPEDTYAMIYAQKIMDVNDAANALLLMLAGKNASFVSNRAPWRQRRQRAVRQCNKRRVGCGGGGVEVQRDFRALHVG